MLSATHPALPSTGRASYFVLAALLLLTLAVGWSGSLITTTQIPGWYAALDKPSWTPPNWLFGPVWTTLYVLIAVAGWRVADRQSAGHHAWGVWWMQMALNAAWTPLFFGAHVTGVALVVILALLATVAWFIRATWRTDRIASLLFMPYLAWIGYASTLNAGIWWLN